VEFLDHRLKVELKKRNIFNLVDIKQEDFLIDHATENHYITNNEFTIHEVSKLKLDDPRNSFYDNLIRNYIDLIYTDPEEESSASFRKTYCHHVLEHLSRHREWESAFEQSQEPYKGFTRCKILIVAPFKGDAIAIIDNLLEIQT
jgi:Utp25, U3 small nucleolar RNA-associated SSU processome protein 25